MRTYYGKAVSGGIAVGRIRVCGKEGRRAERIAVQDPEAEIGRYRAAVCAALEQLGHLRDKALEELGEAEGAIFEVHRMLVQDGAFRDGVEDIIRSQGVNAEYAVAETGKRFAAMFAAMEDDYMRARAGDVEDISGRLLSILGGEETRGAVSGEPAIFVADFFLPSQTVQMDRETVLSFVTVHGSPESHSAILARTMGVPALAGVGCLPLDGALDGKLGIVDGEEGVLYVEPDEETLCRMGEAVRKKQEADKRLWVLKGKDNTTIDGRNIGIYANAGNMGDVDAALRNDCGGIGLFRSEFLYLERDSFPSEEEQFQVYRAVAEKMGKRRVVFRTLDIGADKQCEYFGMEEEENPALGCRGIRICLTRPEIFKTQLKALFRASAYGNVDILYPMITSVGEMHGIGEIVGEVRRELDLRRVPYGTPRQGIMIETPAAAVISDLLAEEADFFSIGTNDLTQYLLAVDRGNGALDGFRDSYHPAVFRMIKLVVENAHKAGIPAAVCGELGADPALTGEFLAMGVDELSVAPDRILPLRKIVRETDVKEYGGMGYRPCRPWAGSCENAADT